MAHLSCPRARARSRLAALLLVTALGACSASSQVEPPRAAAALAPQAFVWPEAAQRFRSGGAWVGGDGAYSIPLGPRRVLWLFGDSFIDPARDGSRTNGPNFFIRNSVGLQTGPDEASARDLSRAALSFHWRTGADHNPSSFFAEEPDGSWFWPLHGVQLESGKLLLFRMLVIKSTGGLGFKVAGWDAIVIDDPSVTPDEFRWRVIAPARRDADRLVGSSVLVDGEHLYAYSVKNDDLDHSSYLARWPLRSLGELSDGALDDPEWFTASGEFVRASASAVAAVVLPAAQVEFSVHRDATLERFVQIQTEGLFVGDPSTAVVMRTAPRPEGPWSSPQALLRPQPRATPVAGSKLAAYAAKAHPEQLGAALVLTYVINDVALLPPADDVYYPEPLRVELAGEDAGR